MRSRACGLDGVRLKPHLLTGDLDGPIFRDLRVGRVRTRESEREDGRDDEPDGTRHGISRLRAAAFAIAIGIGPEDVGQDFVPATEVRLVDLDSAISTRTNELSPLPG